MGTTVSDSHLNLPVHSVDQLPQENAEVKQILVIDHPDLDDEHLLSCLQQSISDTHLSNFQDMKEIHSERLDQLINKSLTETENSEESEIKTNETALKAINPSSSLQCPPTTSTSFSTASSHYTYQAAVKTHIENLNDQSPLTDLFLRFEEKILNLETKLVDKSGVVEFGMEDAVEFC